MLTRDSVSEAVRPVRPPMRRVARPARERGAAPRRGGPGDRARRRGADRRLGDRDARGGARPRPRRVGGRRRLAAAVGQLGDRRVRDPVRGRGGGDRGRAGPAHRRRRVAGGRRTRRAGHARDGRPDRDRGTAAAGCGRRRPGRGDDAARRAGWRRPAWPPGPGPGAGRDAGACPCGLGQRDPLARQRRPGRRCHRPARRPRHPRRRGARIRAGVAAVAVRRRPIVAVLATGDEVRAPGTDLGPAGIPDANGPGLRALVRDAGAVPLDLGIAADTLEDVETRLRRGLAEADLVVVSGGVSVGRTTSSGSRSTTSGT